MGGMSTDDSTPWGQRRDSGEGRGGVKGHDEAGKDIQRLTDRQTQTVKENVNAREIDRLRQRHCVCVCVCVGGWV